MMLCEAELRPETLRNPAEYCDDYAVEGSIYCERHHHAEILASLDDRRPE